MLSEPVILIFDVGKTNKKYFLVNEQYEIVYSCTGHFAETVDEDGFPCDDIHLISEWVDQSIKNVIQLADFEVRAVNFSAYGASFVHLDKHGKIATPLYNYLKPFPGSLSEQFYSHYGDQEAISLQTASPALGNLNSGMQLYRLKRECPETYARIDFSLHLPQYFSFLISGKFSSEITSIGCHTRLWDFKQQGYHDWVIREGLDPKLPPVFPYDTVNLTSIVNQNIPVGIGLHDSSAALLPYLVSIKEPFALISTGTWCISLNPFNETPLTIEELKQDCLFYLSYQGKPVKASRLFAGHYHETEVERIAAFFSVSPDFFKEVKYSGDYVSQQDTLSQIQKLSTSYRANFEPIDPNRYRNAEAAYHHLILHIAASQYYATQLVLNGAPVNKLFVDGGFSNNVIFMKLLANFFHGLPVYTTSIAQASAIGAALAIHKSWNKQEIASGVIKFKEIK